MEKNFPFCAKDSVHLPHSDCCEWVVWPLKETSSRILAKVCLTLICKNIALPSWMARFTALPTAQVKANKGGSN